MKVCLITVCVFTLLACAMAVTCQTGVKSETFDYLADTNCTTSCMRIEFMVHGTVKGIPFSFRLYSFRCSNASDPTSSCVDKTACRTITNNIENGTGHMVTTKNCKAICCSTYRCNVPEEDYKLNYSLGNVNVKPNVPSTVTEAVVTTIRPDLVETKWERPYFLCHVGTINFAYSSYGRYLYRRRSCNTACLTNEIKVTGMIKGKRISFQQTNFACAPSRDYCNSARYCNELEPVISKLDIPSASNLQAENCTSKCCYYTNCNALDPSRRYKLKSGAERTTLQWITLCAISILTAFKLNFPS